MKNNLEDYYEFCQAIQSDDLVFLFGTGTSSMLTGKPYSWWKFYFVRMNLWGIEDAYQI